MAKFLKFYSFHVTDPASVVNVESIVRATWRADANLVTFSLSDGSSRSVDMIGFSEVADAIKSNEEFIDFMPEQRRRAEEIGIYCPRHGGEE